MFNVHINDGSKPIPEGDICYIIGKDGIYLKKKLGIVESCTKVDKISILNDVETYGKLHLPKIPGKVFSRVFGFFRETYLKYKSEAAIILYYNDETKKYKIEVPKQEVSGASVNYEVDIETKRTDNYRVIGTIHSHANFGAFHSGVDSADEKNFDGLHITVGHVAQQDGHFSLSTSIVINGSRFLIESMNYIEDIKPFVEYKSVIIEGIETFCPIAVGNDKNYHFNKNINDEDLEFNPKWMEQVSERKWNNYYENSGDYWNQPGWWNKPDQRIQQTNHRWWERFYKRSEDRDMLCGSRIHPFRYGKILDDYTSLLNRDDKPVSNGHQKWKEFINNNFTKEDHDHYDRIEKASMENRGQKPIGMSKKEWKWFKKNHKKIEEKMRFDEKEYQHNPQLNLFTLDPKLRNVQIHIPCVKCIHRDLLSQVKDMNLTGFEPVFRKENKSEAKSIMIEKIDDTSKEEARKTIKYNFPDLSDDQIEQVLSGLNLST